MISSPTQLGAKMLAIITAGFFACMIITSKIYDQKSFTEKNAYSQNTPPKTIIKGQIEIPISSKEGLVKDINEWLEHNPDKRPVKIDTKGANLIIYY